MRRLLLPLVLAAQAAFAGPVTLSHSGYVLDASDNPLDGPVPVRVGLWTTATGGTRVWWSGATACVATAAHGYYTLTLGADCGGALTTTDLPPDADRWLAVELDGVGLEPRLRLGVGAAAAEALLAHGVVTGGVTSAMLAPTGVSAGSYTLATIAVGSDGRITSATSGTPGVTSITAGTGLTGGTIGSTGTIALATDATSLARVSGGAVSADGNGHLAIGGSNYEALLNVEGSVRTNGLYLSGGTLNLSPGCLSYGTCSGGSGARLLFDAGATVTLKANTPDVLGPGNSAHTLDTLAAASSTGARLLTIRNAGVEKASVDKDGNGAFAGQVRVGASPNTACGAAQAGSLRYGGSVLEWCDGGGTWKAVGSSVASSPATLVLSGSNRQWSDGTVAVSCEAYRRPSGNYSYAGSTGSGTYNIQPPASTVPFVVYCDMDTASGGWTHVLMTNTSGVFNTSTTYSASGGYYLTTPPAHAQIAEMIRYQGTLEAGIANVKLRNYAPNDAAALFSYTNPTWELWSSTWAATTGKTITSCFHSSWQDTCVYWGNGSVGTCSGASSHSWPPSATSWVNHAGCIAGNASSTNLIVAVR